jgi:SAM-dependent methyltransferase
VRVDWDLGRYETIAAQLLPAAQAVVEQAAPRPGGLLLDVGCGTGTAALLAAQRGARAVGVDPAPRLLDLAVEQAEQQRLDAHFVLGRAEALPLDDRSFDLAVSVFGVVFAPEAVQAGRELVRVLRPDGRAVLSAWLPEGALGEVARLRARLLAEATPEAETADAFTQPEPPPFPWHDRDALVGLFGPLGFAVSLQQQSLAFTAASPREFAERELRDHPGWVLAAAALREHGGWEDARAAVLQIFERANEDPAAFRVTSRYLLVTLSREGAGS